MGTSSFFLTSAFLVCFICFTCSETQKQYSVYPNFVASQLQYLDNNGAFLFSPNQQFQASLSSFESGGVSFYFSVIHVSTNSIVWTANRFKPVSNSDFLYLNVSGITITDDSGTSIWSTPPLDSDVSALQLRNSGNLVLLDRNNETIWQSFDYPTDTIVSGQQLSVGKWLESAVAENNLSSGDYRFLVTDDDAVLQWKGMTYWNLSKHKMAFKDFNLQVSYLSINSSGLYLFASDRTTVVYNVRLVQSDLRVAKMEYNGQFTVRSLVDNLWNPAEFTSIDDICQIPLRCGKLGLCRNDSCSCPQGFKSNCSTDNVCVPMNDSFSLPFSCDGTGNFFGSNSISYVKLQNGIDSFSNNFAKHIESVADLSVCQDLCSQNCSCIGLFYENTSSSCFLMDNQTISLMFSDGDQAGRSGYIKVVASTNVMPAKSNKKKKKFIGFVAASSSVFLLSVIFVVIGFIFRRKTRIPTMMTTKIYSRNSSSEELDIFRIPGLPVQFDYEELVTATNNFNSDIGSGGFGTVYKGILPDDTIVAVKKITNLGINGKREFCGEIATIGSIRHVNLVRLKGFSIYGRKRFLVYEYMNKGSLDHALFGPGLVLTWQERFKVAVEVARGLDYLHNGCAHKIIHCDIKPENILLHGNLSVKISDFGLSKLLSPDQSNRVTTLRGTRGYLAPEWLTSSRISDKSDVYSYGMVLLELVSGRRNCSLAVQNPEEQSAVLLNAENSSVTSSSGSESRFVFSPLIALQLHEKRRYMDLLDPQLQGDTIRQEVEMLVKVALCCLQQEPLLRPSMANVVGILQGETKLVEPRIEHLNFLRFYGGNFVSQSMRQLSSVA